MSEQASEAPEVVHGDDLCIRDPGGEGRAAIATTEVDHTPPADPDGLDRMLEPVTDALLAAAALDEGEAVLDIGCGCGATTFSAARAVGRFGAVHGIDVTPSMLDIARTRLASSRLPNVTLAAADAQTDRLPGPADLAISRFGTMFFDDPVAAFANIRRALRPGGRLCIATWQPLDANAWLVIPGAALLHWITLPELDGEGPGMFSQSEPAALAATMAAAGFDDVEDQPIKLALPIGADPDEALSRLADTGVGRAALDAVPVPTRVAAQDAVRAALAEHQRADGVHLGAAILITTARSRT
jgi:SAM-dependent methyltransferase